MQTFFFICFGVGAGYTVLSILLGEVIGLMDFETDFDWGDGAISPLKPSVIAAFLTVFGGAGILLIRRVNVISAISLACVIALVVAYLLYRFVIVNLYKAQNTSAVEKQSLIGGDATVTEYIPQGGYGKITYYVNGNTYSAPAKSEGGSEIKRNSAVEIVYIDRNTYYVRQKTV